MIGGEDVHCCWLVRGCDGVNAVCDEGLGKVLQAEAVERKGSGVNDHNRAMSKRCWIVEYSHGREPFPLVLFIFFTIPRPADRRIRGSACPYSTPCPG